MNDDLLHPSIIHPPFIGATYSIQDATIILQHACSSRHCNFALEIKKEYHYEILIITHTSMTTYHPITAGSINHSHILWKRHLSKRSVYEYSAYSKHHIIL